MALDLSCIDWAERLASGRPLIREEALDLDLREADRAAGIFDRLRLADVPGTPLMADACGPWFRSIVRAVFGSIDRQTQMRRIREVFCLVPKKNSKTSNGALLMLTALLMNSRPRAKFLLTAPVRDVADLAFSQIAGAIALDPVLEAKCHVREHIKTIVHRETRAELEIITFDPAVVTGQKPAGVMIDELHVVSGMSKASSALRQLRGGMLAIPEAFLVVITTQSEDAPAGVFRAELMRARAVRDGRVQGALLPVLYEWPEAVQKDETFWRDPSNWWQITPNLNRSIALERLIDEYHNAVAAGADELRGWASQHLNVEVGVALHSERWAGADWWEQAAEPGGITLDDILARCEVVTVGIDGGGLWDLLALSIVGRETDTGRWLSWGRAWAHDEVRRIFPGQADRFEDFHTDGDLVFSDIRDDVGELVAIVARVYESGLLDLIGVDPVGIDSILNGIKRAGIPLEKVKAVRQGWTLSGPIKTLERRLADGTFRHAGAPLYAWAVSNAKVEARGNAIAITKQTSGAAKIDPLMSLLDAVELMAREPEVHRSIHDARRAEPEQAAAAIDREGRDDDDGEEFDMVPGWVERALEDARRDRRP